MSETTNMKGIEQGRAKQAYADVKAAKGKLGDKAAKEYKSYAKKLPMMIKTNGLGASIAFAKSKGKKGNAWDILYVQIAQWLQQERTYLLGNFTGEDFAEVVISLDSPQYRAVTVETLAYLNWLRRFAEGLIEGEAEETNR
jgi:CRISPR-associated protein Cmr5